MKKILKNFRGDRREKTVGSDDWKVENGQNSQGLCFLLDSQKFCRKGFQPGNYQNCYLLRN